MNEGRKEGMKEGRKEGRMKESKKEIEEIVFISSCQRGPKKGHTKGGAGTHIGPCLLVFLFTIVVGS